jgi:hypothetical protein
MWPLASGQIVVVIGCAHGCRRTGSDRGDKHLPLCRDAAVDQQTDDQRFRKSAGGCARHRLGRCPIGESTGQSVQKLCSRRLSRAALSEVFKMGSSFVVT